MSRAVVTLEVGGGLDLRLDFNALRWFEEAVGRSALSPETWGALDAGGVVALVWAAQRADREAPFHLRRRPVPPELEVLSLEAVGALITADDLEEVQRTLDRAWGLFLPEPSPPSEVGAEDPPAGGD